MLSSNLEQTLHRVLAVASDRRHEYATLEHLLLGLTDDSDAAPVLEACAVDLNKLRQSLGEFLDKDLAGLANTQTATPKPTAGFQRVLQRAAIRVQSAGRLEVTGADVLLALFNERESHSVYFLRLQNVTEQDALNVASLDPTLTTKQASFLQRAISAIGRTLFPRRSSKRPKPNERLHSRPEQQPRSDPEELFGAFLKSQREPPQSPRQPFPTSSPAPDAPASSTQLPVLEANLRIAILDAGARESLIKDAMQRTGGDRATAIRRVLDDLHAEDRRWS